MEWPETVKQIKDNGVKIFYEDSWGIVINADCRDILPLLPKVDLVLTDPPYGIDYTHGESYSRKKGVGSRHHLEKVIGDNTPFDPSFLLKYPKIILFGANNYSSKLPDSKGWIVWAKRLNMKPMDASDCELIWTNIATHVEMIDHRWSGVCRMGEENGKVSLHPTQKPIGLMAKLLERFSSVNDLILDPFLGSGTTMVAAKRLGRYSIGIEISEKYCEIAAKRLSQSVMQLDTGTIDNSTQSMLNLPHE